LFSTKNEVKKLFYHGLLSFDFPLTAICVSQTVENQFCNKKCPQ